MLLPYKSHNDICKDLVDLNKRYSELEGLDWEYFKFLCNAYKQRFNTDITFETMKNIEKIFN